MLEEIYRFGNYSFTATEILVAAIAATLFVLFLIAVAAWRRAARRTAEMAAAREDEVEARMAELIRSQGEITGHVRGLSERIDGFGHHINRSMVDTTAKTQESLMRLNERLAIIDKAQQNITAMSGQMVELRTILANKQTRGAFGQGRMEAIVQDGLPPHAYRFQATLKNGNRPDCLILLPNEAPGIVIDAKFPLEAWNAIRAAQSPEALRVAETQFRRDTQKHIQDIADRYLVPGETQETAFMFIPSESIFADIHERFEDVVQKAHRSRVVIVSPSLLMLSVQVVMSLLRDASMREQAHIIQDEVVKLMDDVARLDERVRRLQGHFSQATTDIDQILITTRKVTGRGARIQSLEFDAEQPKPVAKAKPAKAEPFFGIQQDLLGD
jgi:DNA recombination protein RmuC